MKNKIFIGLTPTQEIAQIKAKLTKLSFQSNTMTHYPNSYHVHYSDGKHKGQLREEMWQEVDPGIFRISMIRSVKDNNREGEQISFIWD